MQMATNTNNAPSSAAKTAAGARAQPTALSHNHFGAPAKTSPLGYDMRDNSAAGRERRAFFDRLPTPQREEMREQHARLNQALQMFYDGDHEGAQRHFFGAPKKGEAPASQNNGHGNSAASDAATAKLNFGFESPPSSPPTCAPLRECDLRMQLPPLKESGHAENAQGADFSSFKGLLAEPAFVQPLAPAHPGASKALNFGF